MNAPVSMLFGKISCTIAVKLNKTVISMSAVPNNPNMYETIDEQLRNHFYQSQKENLKIAEKQVMSNQVSSFAVAFELLDNYFNTNK